MNDSKKRRFEIETVSNYYLASKRVVEEQEMKLRNYEPDRLRVHRYVVYHVEYALKLLNEKDRFIIQKEVIEGERGKWYLGYMTHPSYYRIRDKAYKNFLDCL